MSSWLEKCHKLPVLCHVATNVSDKQHLMIFESARGLCKASQYMLKIAPSLSLSSTQLTQAIQQLKTINHFALNKLQNFKQHYPDLVVKVESYLALRILLNTERQEIQELAHQGMISEVDAEKLVEEVELKMHQHRKLNSAT
jgi:hypothetical protein